MSVVLRKSGKSKQTFVGWPGGVLCGLEGDSVGSMTNFSRLKLITMVRRGLSVPRQNELEFQN
jgi:hypothetical protein